MLVRREVEEGSLDVGDRSCSVGMCRTRGRTPELWTTHREGGSQSGGGGGFSGRPHAPSHVRWPGSWSCTMM
jgi:hypothetical protein